GLSQEAAVAEAQARGPLKEQVLRLAYADPGEVANTLQGVLGLGAQPIEPCIRISEGERETRVEFRTGGGGVTSGPIAEPPFSQLFGPPRTPEQTPPPLVPPEVLARGLAIRAHCATNSLFLRLYATDLDRVKKLILESLDIPLPQVKIEARMEILDRTALEAMATLGKTRNLARPEIVTVENHTASISLGEEIPYATVSSAGTQIQFKEASLKLEVIPMVIRETTDGQERTKIRMFVVVEN